MGAPQARVQLTGDRLDMEWPARASCTSLTARLRLRDGTEHESASWIAVPEASERFRTTCGPLDVEVELQPGDGCIAICASATALAAVDVTCIGISGRARAAGSDLAWVLYNGYQSWDPAGHLPVAGGRSE